MPQHTHTPQHTPTLPPPLPAWLQEKEALKKEKEASEAKYKYAMVDGRQEQV
jgi:hypothetical protein